jgi:hypothetical protein
MVNTVQNQLTLLELAKRSNNGNFLEIAEVLNEINEVLQDGIWVEANQVTSHIGTQRTHLPSGSWKQINVGIAKSASATKQVTEPVGVLEDYSIVDKRLVDLASDPMKFRSDEDIAHVEGMSQTIADGIIYGSIATTPEAFNGFATRYNLTSMANVYGAGGTGSDTTSLWLVEWGPRKVHFLYPKGTTTIVSTKDLGIRPAYDSGTPSLPYEAYWTHFAIAGGIYVHDDRCVQRIANIETTGTSSILSDDDIITAMNQMPNPSTIAGVKMYVNRTLKTQLEILAKDKSNVNYTSDNAFGAPITRFRGVPVRLCEAIVDTETAIS